MKPITISLFFGVLLALGITAALQPLNAGAVGLVVFLSVGATTAIGAVLHRRTKGEPKKND
jgi:hypothetical protein